MEGSEANYNKRQIHGNKLPTGSGARLLWGLQRLCQRNHAPPYSPRVNILSDQSSLCLGPTPLDDSFIFIRPFIASVRSLSPRTKLLSSFSRIIETHQSLETRQAKIDMMPY